MNKIVFECLMILLSLAIAYLLLKLEVGIVFFVISIILASILITKLKRKFYSKS